MQKAIRSTHKKQVHMGTAGTDIIGMVATVGEIMAVIGGVASGGSGDHGVILVGGHVHHSGTGYQDLVGGGDVYFRGMDGIQYIFNPTTLFFLRKTTAGRLSFEGQGRLYDEKSFSGINSILHGY
jgi:hypothetical protein